MKKRDFLIIIIFFLPFFSCNADNPLLFILNKTDSISSPKSNVNSSIKAVNFDLIKELIIKVGEERFLIPTTTYKDSNTSNSNQDVIWSSEDPTIVSVDKGKIKALKTGSSIIYAKSKIDDSKYYSLLIKVPEEVVQPTINPTNNSTLTTVKPSIPVAQTTVYVTQTVYASTKLLTVYVTITPTAYVSRTPSASSSSSFSTPTATPYLSPSPLISIKPTVSSSVEPTPTTLPS